MIYNIFGNIGLNNDTMSSKLSLIQNLNLFENLIKILYVDSVGIYVFFIY